MTVHPTTKSFQTEVRFVSDSFSKGVRPPEPIDIAKWAAENFVVPTGPYKGKKLDLRLTPYLPGILECLSPEHPCTRVSIKKSAQTGVSTLAMVWLFALIDSDPDDMMLVLPTLGAARDFNREKLVDAIRLSPKIKSQVAPQKSRSGDGSTTLQKVFPGGRLILTGANSSADLSSKTARYAVADEIDRFPQDVEDQGHPLKLLDARQISFTRLGTHKKLEISTPTIKGLSMIDEAYEAGDQGRWMMPCVHCAEPITFEFDNLDYNKEPPYEPVYTCQKCGVDIHAWQQRQMVLAGEWVATAPGAGRHPSFFIDTMISLLTSWEKLVEAYFESRGDQIAEKSFTNLWRGLSFEVEGQDLDPARIALAADTYPRDVVPSRVGRTVLAVDTQDDRFEWAYWGFGPTEGTGFVEQTLISAGVIEGDLNQQGPWDELAALGERKWPHSTGREFGADLKVIDSGGHFTQKVYRFVHRRRGWRALKGASNRDALMLGTPKRVEVKDERGAVLFRVPLQIVNTYDLKVWLNAALKAIETGQEIENRLRLCAEVADEDYVKQMCNEVLVPMQKRNGRIISEWHKIGANEALDCAVYARAFAFGPRPLGLGVDRLKPAQWEEILIDRHERAGDAPDLLTGVHATTETAREDLRQRAARHAERLNK